MNSLQGKTWMGGYSFRPFEVKSTCREFAFSRRSIAGSKTPSNLSVICTSHLRERLTNGVLQGRKQFTPQGASVLCKKSMWKAVAEVVAMLGVPVLESTLSHGTYGELKLDECLANRRKVKEDIRSDALKGWIANGGEDFTLSD